MTIGFDGSRAFVKDKTGTENYSCQLLKALAKIDFKNNYIIYIRSGTKGETLRGWPLNFTFRVIKWFRLWTQFGLARQTFKDKLDLLFIPAHTSPLFHKPGLKTVVTVHDLGAEYLPKMHQLKQRVYLKWITRYQLRSATKLIAVSNATKEDLVRKVGIKPDKIEVVYEGYNKANFKFQPFDSAQGKISNFQLENTLRRFGIERNNYFLFVGTIQPRKNLERLIKAFSSLRGILSACSERSRTESRRTTKQSNKKIARLAESAKRATPYTVRYMARNDGLKLVIVGQKGWLSDEIYKLPKKLGIEDKVKFLGHVDDEYLPTLYSGAIALTFPSLFEGFGLPILEAQACGCPVLTSNVSSMPEVGGKGALYVNPNSVDDIIRGMIEVQSRQRRASPKAGLKLEVKSLVKAGLENVKRFSWEKCATQTLEVFEKLKV